MIHRFFIPPDWIDYPLVKVHNETARQIKTVLRMKRGDTIIVLDNSGLEYTVTLTKVDRNIEGHIINRQQATNEPDLQLTLYQGTLKASNFEWVLQKGTELGICRFVPTICQRSVVSNVDNLLKKYQRWQKIIKEAAEQSRRGKLPHLSRPTPFLEAVQHFKPDTLLLMAWEEAYSSLKPILTANNNKTIALFIGTEGGFTTAEATAMAEAGGEIVKLGGRILRAETAGLAVCSAIFYEMGEWEWFANKLTKT